MTMTTHNIVEPNNIKKKISDSGEKINKYLLLLWIISLLINISNSNTKNNNHKND